MKRTIETIFALVLCAAPTFAQRFEHPKITSEIAPFVETDTKAIALETADLNGDGRADFILVLDAAKADDAAGESERPLLILTRQPDGKLILAARNDEVVYCRNCGGVYGDPFDGVTVRRGGFTVSNVGGSSDRWLENYEFRYSRRDKTWQLVRSVSTIYNVFKPKRMKTKILTPKNFGKINFADFSLDIFQKKAAR